MDIEKKYAVMIQYTHGTDIGQIDIIEQNEDLYPAVTTLADAKSFFFTKLAERYPYERYELNDDATSFDAGDCVYSIICSKDLEQVEALSASDNNAGSWHFDIEGTPTAGSGQRPVIRYYVTR